MDDIKTLTLARKREVENLIEGRRAELATLEAELASIDSIISSQGFTIPEPVTAKVADTEPRRQSEPRPTRDKTLPTIKEKILTVLAEHPDGFRMKELHAELETRFGDDILEKSVVPQVSRLRDALKIYKTTEGFWRLAPAVENQDTTDGDLTLAV